MTDIDKLIRDLRQPGGDDARDRELSDRFALTPPVDQKTREDMADCLSSILSDIGGWLEDPDLLKNVDELIAIARRNTPQPASNHCALPEDAAAAKDALGG